MQNVCGVCAQLGWGCRVGCVVLLRDNTEQEPCVSVLSSMTDFFESIT